jgi:hypothetical protein
MNTHGSNATAWAGILLLLLGLGIFGYEFFRAHRIIASLSQREERDVKEYRIDYLAGHFFVSRFHSTYYSNAFPPAWLKFAFVLAGSFLFCSPILEAALEIKERF